MTPKQMVEILDGQLTDCYAEIEAKNARIAELKAALQEIASYGNMNDKVGWAVQAARKALKLANDKGE
jgi:Zn-dependent membrane protease YugP